MMEEFDYRMVREYIEGNWADFQGFCQERDIDADELLEKLESQE